MVYNPVTGMVEGLDAPDPVPPTDFEYTSDQRRRSTPNAREIIRRSRLTKSEREAEDRGVVVTPVYDPTTGQVEYTSDPVDVPQERRVVAPDYERGREIVRRGRDRVRDRRQPVNTGTKQEIVVNPVTLQPEITGVDDVSPVETAVVQESGMVVSPDGVVYERGQPIVPPVISDYGYGQQLVETASSAVGFDQLLTLIIQLFVEIFGFSPQTA